MKATETVTLYGYEFEIDVLIQATRYAVSVFAYVGGEYVNVFYALGGNRSRFYEGYYNVAEVIDDVTRALACSEGIAARFLAVMDVPCAFCHITE